MVNKQTLKFSPPAGVPNLITENKETINQFVLSIHYITAVCIYRANYLKRLDIDANRLALLLQKEYPDLKWRD